MEIYKSGCFWLQSHFFPYILCIQHLKTFMVMRRRNKRFHSLHWKDKRGNFRYRKCVMLLKRNQKRIKHVQLLFCHQILIEINVNLLLTWCLKVHKLSKNCLIMVRMWLFRHFLADKSQIRTIRVLSFTKQVKLNIFPIW